MMNVRLTAAARPKPVAPMRHEGERLKALADAIEGHLPQSLGVFLTPWRQMLARWMSAANLDTLDGERAMDTLALELRYLWLRYAHEQSARLLMSPPHANRKRLPDLTAFGFPYDRWLKPEAQERRLIDARPAPEGWVKDAVVFASGMAAITVFLQYHRANAWRFFPPVQRAMSVHWFGGYFEISRALQLICDRPYLGRHHADQATLNDLVAKGLGDLVLIEPVAADLDLAVFDLDAFARAWRKRDSQRACVLLIDTSLVGDAFPIERLFAELGPRPPALIAEVRSGLKLDQQGLELSNVGLLSLYAPEGARFGKRGDLDLDDLINSLRVARTTFGAGLSADEFAALSAPFFLDPAALNSHAQAVFDNNARFARALAPYVRDDGLISGVIHPCLRAETDKPWAVAPFVNIKYTGAGEGQEGSDEARDFFKAVLQYEAQTRRLTFQSGSSFGFRAHRFEMGFVRGHKYDTVRIALGSRAGPSLDGVIALFQEFAGYPDFDALRRAYAGIVKTG